jgi:hypothetical protein
MKPKLSQLQRINLREAWRHEALEFTPWLAEQENLDRLADALGLSELELVQAEHWVGDFKLDILCSDDSGPVIIENQLEKTNHVHLGQIVTYAAGVGAKKVIWVAESFRAEHVAAFEFLNQNTTDDLNFFAVEIELWRIADSPLAPSFKVVCKPNDWAKSGRENARAASVATPTKQRQLKFWTEFVARLAERTSAIKPQKPRPQHWIQISLGRAGFILSGTASQRDARLGVEVYINEKDAKLRFEQLRQQRESIETKLGYALDWQELPDAHACRIALYRPESPLEDETRWPEYIAWMIDQTMRMSDVFRPVIRALP